MTVGKIIFGLCALAVEHVQLYNLVLVLTKNGFLLCFVSPKWRTVTRHKVLALISTLFLSVKVARLHEVTQWIGNL